VVGRCEICREDRLLCQDHDHGNGLCRGRLCNACNSGLGFFGDDPERLRRGAVYVEEWAGAHEQDPERWPSYEGKRYDAESARAHRVARRAQKRQATALRLQAKSIRAVLKGWARLDGRDARGKLRAAIRILEDRAAARGKR
jgi:hypothetical protein